MQKVTKHLENLRAKPESYRRRVAFAVSSGITLVILLFWVASLGTTVSTLNSAQAPATSPSTSLTGSVSDSFGSIKNIFSSLFSSAKNVPSPIEVLPGSMNKNNQNNQ